MSARQSAVRLVLLLAFLGGCVPSTPVVAPVRSGTAALFDWFDYDGHDPIYDSLKAGPDQYLNPILAGFHPDPSIVRAGDDYYLVNSSFAYYPGVPIFHSRDLVDWTQIGHVLDRPSQLALDSAGVSRGIYAPTIRYQAGIFYLITTLVDRGGNFIVTASDPAGPWSDPIWLPQVDGIDPSLFFDDDGRAYVLNNGPPVGEPLYEGHRALWIQEYDVDARRTVGPRTLLVNGGVDIARHPIWIEGPHLFKARGRYYLIAAEGGTRDQHSEVVFRSDSIRGPYVPYVHNPILTQRSLDPARPYPITSTGHADLVELPNGDWWAVFLGTRPYADDSYNTGRETFLLPVSWSEGWPVILDSTRAVPYVHARPGLAAQRAPDIPTHGNFELRDEFDQPTLAPYWNLLRTPRTSWYDLDSHPGFLSIRGRPADLSGESQPSFIGRRQQHGWATASTAMRYRPEHLGDRAGLAAFGDEDHYFLLAVTLSAGQRVIALEERAGGSAEEPVTIATAPLHLDGDAPLYLRIAARGARYDFYYGYRPGEWVLLKGDADGTILSTKAAEGFVGAYFGMYVYADAPSSP